LNFEKVCVGMKKGAIVFSIVLVLLLMLNACDSSSKNTTSNTTDNNQTIDVKKESNQPKEQKNYTADDVINKLKEAGLNISQIVTYTESTDSNNLLGRPGQYIAKTNFGVTELETDGNPDMDVSMGGSVEIFANEKDAKARYDYVTEISKSAPMFAEYDYLNGKMLLRLSSQILPSKVVDYEKTFKSLK
jgi:hypothetical protein